MAKQLSVNLAFTADTSKAKQQVKELQQQLTNLVTSTYIKGDNTLGLDKEIQKATVAAATLKKQLTEATNIKTGNLDLGKFNQSLKQSGITIQDYKKALLQLGPEGAQAFSSLAQSITMAEVPLRRSNAALMNFMTTLKNTAKWQISSTMLHGFQGAIQTAFYYAKDLNESLNNIRIVTGQNTQQMAQFASEANKAAKALSSTTLDYTNASLIYYQQGLSDSEVKERTDTTIKMANVSRESAEEVSEQMTAIWNNFDKGSKSLEYYADVMTALGAATASSTAEISEGLEKFAAVADTVGLSYEYATAALATVTSTTRESADVVGNAFKTLFARIEGLSLGETLDDGTDLNKYSKALAAVGIDIKDTNGDMKQMDAILDELGSKWGTLAKDQQLALAQTVAGVRQYTQLVALMDNWDFFQKNLSVARDSEGSLQEQADIYAESWEAAEKRVQASMEEIYSQILNDKFFIDLNKGFASFLDGISGVIKGLGGIKGVLLTIGTISLNVFQKQIGESLQNTLYNIQMLTSRGRENILALRNETNKALSTLFSDQGDTVTGKLSMAYSSQATVQKELLANASSMTEQQRMIAQILVDQHNTLVQESVEQAKIAENAEATAKAEERRQRIALKRYNEKVEPEDEIDQDELVEYQNMIKQSAAFDFSIGRIFEGGDADIESNRQKLLSLIQVFDKTQTSVEGIGPTLKKAFGTDGYNALVNFEQVLKKPEATSKELKDALIALSNATDNFIEKTANAQDKFDGIIDTASIERITVAGNEYGALIRTLVQAGLSAQNFKNKLSEIPTFVNNSITSITKLGSQLSALSMAISSIIGLVNTWNNEDLSFGEKLLQTMTTLGIIIPTVTSALNKETLAQMTEAMAKKMNLVSTVEETTAETALAGAKTATTGASVGTTGAEAAETGAHAANTGAIVAETGAVVGLETALLPLLAVFAAIAAAIGGAIVVGYGLVKAYEAVQAASPAGQLEAAAEAAKRASKALDSTTRSAEELKSKLDSLSSSYKVIDNLTVGTEQWHEELIKINAEVAKLIKAYPELNKYMQVENGIYRISEEGIEEFRKRQNEEIATATNISISANKKENEKQINYNNSTLADYSALIPDASIDAREILRISQEIYRGEGSKFTAEEIKAITDAFYGNLNSFEEKYGKDSGKEYYNEAFGGIQKFLSANEELLEKNRTLVESNQKVADMQLTQRGSSLGSTRDAKQLEELVGNYDDILKKSREDIEKQFGLWQEHRNYDLDKDNIQTELIEQFMKYQPEGAEYKGQQWGNLVYELDGKSVKISQEEFFDQLAEINASKTFKNKFSTQLKAALEDSLKNVKLDDFDLSTLIGLDELQRKLQTAFEGINNTSAKDIFSNVIQSFGTDEEAIKDFTSEINSIDWSNVDNLRQFNEAALELQSGTKSIEDFTLAIDKMAASAKLDSMGSFFEGMAEKFGMSKDSAEQMQEYAKYIMDIAEESEEFSDELAANADSAAALAVEITRMNKGIEELSDGFEEWSDILKNSTKESEEYAQACSNLKNSLADILGVESDLISNNFVENHLEDIEKAANGDAEAIDLLRSSMDEEIIQKVTVGQSENLVNDINNLNNTIQTEIEKLDPTIEVGAILQDQGFIDAANALVEKAGMSADEANAYFAGIGYEPLYTETEVDNSAQLPNGTTTTQVDFSKPTSFDVIDPLGGKHTVSLPLPTISTVSKSSTPTEAPGGFNLVSFSGDGKKPAAKKIGGFRKKATGSYNNHSSSNAGGTPLKKSSGGGGGSGSVKEPDHKDPLEEQIDRYHDVNNAIKTVNQSLERQNQLEQKLSAYEEHYSGKTLISALGQQNKFLKEKNNILEQQYNNYKQLQQLQLQELGELKGKIGGNWNGNVLTNYNELVQNNIDRYNAVIAAYNAMSAEQQEAIGKQQVEDAEKLYNKTKEDLENYQTLYYDKMMETENNAADVLQQQLENQMAIIENNLKSWEIKLQLKFDKTELERDFNDFLETASTEFKKVYQDLTVSSDFDSSNFDTYLKDAKTQMKAIRDVEREIDRMEDAKDENGVVQLDDSFMFGSISEAQEKLKELQKELLDSGKSLAELYKALWDNYIEGIEQAADNFGDLNDQFEHITNELEYEKQLVELIFGDKAFDLMNKFYDTQQRNIETQITSTRAQAAFWQEQFQKAYEMNKDEQHINMDDMSTWTEDMRKAYDEMIDSQEKLNDLVIEGIENVRDKYLNNISKTFSELDKALWGMDFDDVKKDWDFLQKKADEYLDDVEGAYQIQTLANKFDSSIAEMSSLKAQQKLAALREEEIDFLREKEHLTQSDIDLAEARYQIALKEIALENAQNNKTSMKLMRNESGNWTYQYVADDEEVATKRQELLDAYNDLYKMADEAYKHAMELAMDMYEEYCERVKEIAEDTTLTEEEKLEKIRELQDQYYPEIIAAAENASLYEKEAMYAAGAVFKEVCDQDEDAYRTLTDAQKALVDEIRDQHLNDYEEIRKAIIENYDEIGQKAEDTFFETNINSQTAAAQVIKDWDTAEGQESVRGALQDAFDKIIEYTQGFEDELRNLEDVSGKTILDEGGVADDFNKLGEEIVKVGDKVDDLVEKSNTQLDALRGYVNDTTETWKAMKGMIGEAIDQINDYLKVQENAIQAQRELQQEIAETIAAQADLDDVINSADSDGGGGSSGGGGYSGGYSSTSSSKSSTSNKVISYTIQLKNSSDDHHLGSVSVMAGTSIDSAYKEAAAQMGVNVSDFKKKYIIQKTGTWDTYSNASDSGTGKKLTTSSTKKNTTTATTTAKKNSDTGYTVTYNGQSSPAKTLKVAQTQAENILKTHLFDKKPVVIKNNKTGKTFTCNNLADVLKLSQNLYAFDTGGYTGDWDDQNGKLAVLHQKELVLNKTDTQNMLQAVNAIRDIAGLNNSISETIANAIGNLVLKTIGIKTGYNTGTTNNSSNIFNITAEFPNANDVQTIKDAILSLPNIASQFIHQN